MNLILALSGWHHTLSGDLRNYYFPIANHIFTSQTLIYPPGANLSFLLLPAVSFTAYELSFVAVNIILLFFLWRLVKNSLVFWLIVIAAGPIIFFRFDLLVMVLLVLSIKFFQKESFLWSGIFLGAATITKFFPLVLFPYFLLILFNKPAGNLTKFLLSFFVALAGILLIYFGVTGLNWSRVVSGLTIYSSISVHMESVTATALTLITAFTNPGPHGVSFENALWVLNPLYFLGHARLFKFFPVLGLIFIYILIFLFLRRQKEFEPGICILVILVLIISSQIFSPQYLLWVAFLFPLLPRSRINLCLLLVALVCTQIIYPLNYGELIDFFNLGKNLHLFLVLVLRNAALVLLTIRLFKNAKETV